MMSVYVHYVTHYHLPYFLVQMCLAVILKYQAGYIGENIESIIAKLLHILIIMQRRHKMKYIRLAVCQEFISYRM